MQFGPKTDFVPMLFCRQQHMYDELTKTEDKNQYEAIFKKGITHVRYAVPRLQ